MTDTQTHSPLPAALPFALSFLCVPLAALGAIHGGWVLILLPVYGWVVFSVLDALTGLSGDNPDPEAPPSALWRYRVITLIWPPLQGVVLFGALAWVGVTDHLSGIEIAGLFAGIGIITGAIGINYAHELMHQPSRLERWLADFLLASVLYSHFRTEHLLVHHRYVGTPRDPVTARYNEGFHRFFARVLWQCFASALRAEADLQARRDKSGWSLGNPFWRYAALQAGFMALAYALAGWLGVACFALQAAVAVWQLELVNYIEHYGLTRKYLGDGRYEPVGPRHSWNATHRASNWLLINLQRHSDHHYKPARRFPLLQTYAPETAPHLPFGYPLMTMAAMVPPVFRRVMNPRVRAWRRRHYPEIEDWSPYKAASNPLPR